MSTPQHAPRRLRRGQCLVVFGFLGRPICQARCPARWAELCWPEGWLSKCTVCRTLAAYLTCRPCPVSSRTRGPRRRGAGSGASPQLGGKPAETKVPRPVPADAHKAKRHAPPCPPTHPPKPKNMHRRPPGPSAPQGNSVSGSIIVIGPGFHSEHTTGGGTGGRAKGGALRGVLANGSLPDFMLILRWVRGSGAGACSGVILPRPEATPSSTTPSRHEQPIRTSRAAGRLGRHAGGLPSRRPRPEQDVGGNPGGGAMFAWSPAGLAILCSTCISSIL